MKAKIVEISGFDYYGNGSITFDVDGYEYLVEMKTKWKFNCSPISEIDRAVGSEISSLCNAMGDDYDEDEDDESTINNYHLDIVNDYFCKDNYPYLWAALEANVYALKKDFDMKEFMAQGINYEVIHHIYAPECSVAVVLAAGEDGPYYQIWELHPWNEHFVQTTEATLEDAVKRAKAMVKDMKSESAY